MNYSYLSDGTKLSALDGSGEGLVYRGPFVYRKSSGSNAGSSLTLESAAFGGGRLTPDGAMLYVTDYLGSVRAVVDGKTGELYKASDYSAFGDESVVMVRPQGNTPPQPLATAVLPAGLTLRDGYTGKEAQTPDFNTGYTDFGARQYSPTLRRWMTPDPLSEKYYGVSPYAFCDNNPVNFVDPDGEAYGKVLKVGKKIYKAAKAGKKISVKGILKSEWLDIVDNAHTIIDPDASLFEKGVAGINLATGFGDEVKWFAKAVGVSDAVIDGTRVIDGIKFKSFTERNFRDNLMRLTGEMPDASKNAHHIFPKAIDNFKNTDINPNDPRYGIWLDADLHLGRRANLYNAAWNDFFKENPNPTTDELFEQARKLMKEIYDTEVF